MAEDLEGLNFNIKIDEESKSQDNQQPGSSWDNTTQFQGTNSSAPPTALGHVHSEGVMGGWFATAQNPVTCLFHVLFKAASLVSFLFMYSTTGDEIITFVLVVMFQAFDFWTVKNVTGRILVQLRWWSEIDELGVEKWVYESDSRTAELAAAASGDEEAKKAVKRTETSNATDARVFWMFVYGNTCVWGFFLFMDIIQFKFFWAITSGICFTLSLTNAQGYYLCQKTHKQKLSDYIQERGMNMFAGAMAQGYVTSIIQGAPAALMNVWRGGSTAAKAPGIL